MNIALTGDVLVYLDQVQRDVPDHLADLRSASATETQEPDRIGQLMERESGASLARYCVNSGAARTP
jgi:hypothetical protein